MADSCYVGIGHGPRLLSVGGLWQVVAARVFQTRAAARIMRLSADVCQRSAVLRTWRGRRKPAEAPFPSRLPAPIREP